MSTPVEGSLACCSLARVRPFVTVLAGKADDARPLEPGAKAFGKTLNEWAGEWSNWVFQFPSSSFRSWT